MADRRRRWLDDGFTLVEVIVALGILMVVSLALLPQMVAGARSVSVADHETVLKGVLQQEVDRLRGLPFRVSLGSSGAGTDADVDLLDIYFPNVSTTAPAALTCTDAHGYTTPAATWKGYVGDDTPGRRCAYEPGGGAFYRTVTPSHDARLGDITIVRDTQFVGGGTKASPAPVVKAPAATYDSDHATTNYPPAPQIGVTVTVLYRDRGETKARSTYTQIAQQDSGPTLVRTSVDVTAVDVTSLSPTGASMSLDAGVVGLDASVGDISSATASLAGVVARVATGDPSTSQFGYGATSTTVAPPSITSVDTETDSPSWDSGCTGLLCWGSSRVGPDSGSGVLTDSGLPRVGTASDQLRSSITDGGSQALSFSNLGSAIPNLPLSGPVARLVGVAPGTPSIADPTAHCPLGTNAGARLSGSGYLTTSLHNASETQRDTAACGSARSAAVGVMPIGSWAPDGVVKVTLNRSYAWCQVVGGTATGDAAMDVTVEVSDGADGYQAAVPAGTVTLSTPIPGHGTVGDYLQGWTVGVAEVTPPGTNKVTATMPGLVVITKPTREADDAAPDDDSAVVVTVGRASCQSESSS